ARRAAGVAEDHRHIEAAVQVRRIDPRIGLEGDDDARLDDVAADRIGSEEAVVDRERPVKLERELECDDLLTRRGGGAGAEQDGGRSDSRGCARKGMGGTRTTGAMHLLLSWNLFRAPAHTAALAPPRHARAP